MINQWPQSQRRLLALVILLITGILLYSLIISPLLSRYLQYGDSIESLQNQLTIYQRMNAGSPELETQLQQLKRQDATQEIYLSETKPALAAARLQQHLSDVISISGGQIISTQIINAPDPDPLTAVAIQVHMQLEINELVALLHGLESGRPLLFVDDLAVTTITRAINRQQRNRRQDTRREVLNTRPLDVRFKLLGYASKEPVI